MKSLFVHFGQRSQVYVERVDGKDTNPDGSEHIGNVCSWCGKKRNVEVLEWK